MTDRRPLRKTALIAGAAVFVALALTAFVVVLIRPQRLADSPRVAAFLLVKVFVTTFTVVVLLALTSSYATLYRDIPNQFTLSLVVICLSLLLYALTANPLVHLVFGIRVVAGIAAGPFTFIPDLFAAFAVLLLLYQSYR